MREQTYRQRRHRARWLRDKHDRAVRRRDYRYLIYEESIRAHRRIEAGADLQSVWPRLERRLVQLLRGTGNASITLAQAAAYAAEHPFAKTRKALSWSIFGWSDRWNWDRVLEARALYQRAIKAEQASDAFDRLFTLEESLGIPD